MSRRKPPSDYSHILQDVSLVALSVFVSIMLVKTHTISLLLDSSQEYGHIASFFAGMMFTTVFTTAPAIAVLGEISQYQGALETALWAALGAVIGDMLIFRFIRDRVAEHLTEILAHKRGWKRAHKVLKYRFFRYLTFLVGGLIIASPLPDELGISLLGFSKMKQIYFVPLSFVFNFIGILLVGHYVALAS